MAVLSRSVGVPARLAVGYTAGDKVDDQGIYSVMDSNSHGWVEVYSPGFGWIPFGPTPGEALPGAYRPGAEDQLTRVSGLADGVPSDQDCFDEFELCDGDSQSPIDFGDGSRDGFGVTLVGLWPWILIAMSASILVGETVRWFWKRFMAVPEGPTVAFQRMTILASLAAAGPADFHTPYQFGNGLQEVLPAQETPVSIIVAAYVRSRYGNKLLTVSERRRLGVAWRMLRLTILWAVIRRRVR